MRSPHQKIQKQPQCGCFCFAGSGKAKHLRASRQDSKAGAICRRHREARPERLVSDEHSEEARLSDVWQNPGPRA